MKNAFEEENQAFFPHLMTRNFKVHIWMSQEIIYKLDNYFYVSSRLSDESIYE